MGTKPSYSHVYFVSDVIPLFSLLFCLALLLFPFVSAEIALDSCNPSNTNTPTLLERTKQNFYHAYNAYKTNALPYDELRPLTCNGTNTFGGLTLSLIDTLDTLILLRDWPEFRFAIYYIRDNLSFDINSTVSVFEINIRVLGGLLSAHGFLTEAFDDTAFDAWLWCPNYDGFLLYLAQDLADRLMPAFNTPTSIPYGSIHLQRGVDPAESVIASTAGAGTLLLEFGTLSRYTRLPKYYTAAFSAMSALHSRASQTGLVGNHINILSGTWVATDSGVGGLIDSFYEYMLKGYILFGDERLLTMLQSSYGAVEKFVHKQQWYLNADMFTGTTSSLTQSSLSAFFPGMQVMMGFFDEAIETTRAHYSVWRRYGCLPEGYQVLKGVPTKGQVNYPLRPELVESVFYLHWATRDPAWIGVAKAMLTSLEALTKVDCGFAQIADVRTHEKENLMDSFVMSETLKYMYLVFLNDENHWSRSGKYIFSTEAHPFRIVTDQFQEILRSSKAASGSDDKASRKQASSKGFDVNRDNQVHPQWKCLRRPKMENKLPCGYGMTGTDWPVFRRDDIQVEEVPADVVSQVEEVMRKRGIDGLKLNELFLGQERAYRISRVENREVFFTKLGSIESEMERKRHRRITTKGGCWSLNGRDLVRGVCRWSDNEGRLCNSVFR